MHFVFAPIIYSPSLSLTQVILSLASLRPRFNLDSPYFTSCYNQEVSCLKQQAATVGSFLEDLIGVERAHSKSVCVSDEDRSKGLPICVPLTHPISLSGKFSMWEFIMCVQTDTAVLLLLVRLKRKPQSVDRKVWSTSALKCQ